MELCLQTSDSTNEELCKRMKEVFLQPRLMILYHKKSVCEFSYWSFKVITVTLSCWSIMFTYCRSVMERIFWRGRENLLSWLFVNIWYKEFSFVLRADSYMRRETDTIEQTEVMLAVQGHKSKVQQDPQPFESVTLIWPSATLTSAELWPGTREKLH